MTPFAHTTLSTVLRPSLLALSCFAAFSAGAQTVAGQVQYTQGVVMVSRAGAAPIAMAKGTAIQAGDTITTGEQGNVQMRFTDGGFIALHATPSFPSTGMRMPKTQTKTIFWWNWSVAA